MSEDIAERLERHSRDDHGGRGLLHDAAEEIKRLQAWLDDLQSGMYINCVYCGHRYGPREDTPTSMANVLRAHVEKCPLHPLSRAREEIERLREELNVESVRPAAADLLATWDANEWAERADGGELAESIKALREAAEAARDA